MHMPSLPGVRLFATAADSAGGKSDLGAEWEEEKWELRRYKLTEREYIFNLTTKEIRPIESVDQESGELLPFEAPMVRVSTGKGADEFVERELRWEEHRELKGDRMPYYLNRATGESTWEFPFEDPDLVPSFARIEEYPLTSVPSSIECAPVGVRIGAAAIDLGVTLTTVSLYSCLIVAEMGITKSAPGIFLLLMLGYISRDAFVDSGSRSFGKRYLGLEIVRTDGTLPGRRQTVGRNVVAPISIIALAVGGFFSDLYVLSAAGALFAAEFGASVATGRGLGDYIFGTKVIRAQEDRDKRLEERVAYLLAEENAS